MAGLEIYQVPQGAPRLPVTDVAITIRRNGTYARMPRGIEGGNNLFSLLLNDKMEFEYQISRPWIISETLGRCLGPSWANSFPSFCSVRPRDSEHLPRISSCTADRRRVGLQPCRYTVHHCTLRGTHYRRCLLQFEYRKVGPSIHRNNAHKRDSERESRHDGFSIPNERLECHQFLRL